MSVERWDTFNIQPKTYLISPTKSLTFLKTEECSEVNQNFVSFTGSFSKILAIIIQGSNNSTIFTRKHVQFSDIILETIIWRNLTCKFSWLWPYKVKNDPKLVRDSNSSLKLLTFQLCNISEWETIKYAFDYSKVMAKKWQLLFYFRILILTVW